MNGNSVVVQNQAGQEVVCAHCGDPCDSACPELSGQSFCCRGCLWVYRLLSEKNLATYYRLNASRGISLRAVRSTPFDVLDQPDVRDKLVRYSVNGISRVTFRLPQIYCSACIWLLENLGKLESGILKSRVNFLRKEVTVTFRDDETTVRKVAELLATIGYPPQINLANLQDKADRNENRNRSLYLKVGLAGFCFGNIMLLAFPEYLSGGGLEPAFREFFGFLTVALALPVLYAASDYFSSAVLSLRLRRINMDVPISLGILALFGRSVYEILSGAGSGYLDSMSGLVFFLLVGRTFQQKTYHALAFDGDFKSYFPLSVSRRNGEGEEQVIVSKIETGDRLVFRNTEIIPTDGRIQSSTALIDYSFVTGESAPVLLRSGDRVLAGGRLVGTVTEVEVLEPCDQSYLTQLWNQETFSGTAVSHVSHVSNLVARYFTGAVLLIAFGSLIYWLPRDAGLAWNAVTAVLIVACPCALALSVPFTYGAALRVLGRSRLFLRNDKIVESLARIRTVVFDKTGTLTEVNRNRVEYQGPPLTVERRRLIRSLALNSIHPFSRLIADFLSDQEPYEVQQFEEKPGYGTKGVVNGREIRLGSLEWIGEGNRSSDPGRLNASAVGVSVSGCTSGHFRISSTLRSNVGRVLRQLKETFEVMILSGDGDGDRAMIDELVGGQVTGVFNQLPDDKLCFVKKLEEEGKTVLMVGDGLNDAGALSAAEVGIAVTEQSSRFTPASDGIMLAETLHKLPDVMKLARCALMTVYFSFTISFLYNIVGMIFAVQGLLSPLLAAILMPLSSLTVVLFAVGSITYHAKRLNLG